MKTRIIGIAIVLEITFFIFLGCTLIINRIFKKAKLNESKNFRQDMKNTFANSFIKSSIFSMIIACIIYGFLGKILETFHLSNGIINYCEFVAKIWFISSPFIGLELAIFKYFQTIEYNRKIFIILIVKALIYIVISLCYYGTRKFNCFIYAKPITDFIFLFYYSRICFDITLNKC